MSQPVEVPNMNRLESDYQTLQDQYRSLATEAETKTDAKSLNPILEKLQRVNRQIAEVLDRMLTNVAKTKENGASISTYRDDLVKALRRIQIDYNNLRTNTDTLETLRRIREYESSKATGSLNWYLLGFLVLCFLLPMFILIFGRQRSSDATYAMPATPAMMAPLT